MVHAMVVVVRYLFTSFTNLPETMRRRLWGGAYEAARGGPGLLPVAAAGGGCFQWLGSKARHCWNSTRCSKGPLRCRSIGPVGWLVSLEAQLKGAIRSFQADSNSYEYLVALFESNTNSGQRYSNRIRIVPVHESTIRIEYE